jgi:restriction endonuclease S subunit
MTALPIGWESRRVDEVGEVITGSTPSTSDPANWNGVVPFVTPGDLVHLGMTTETGRTLTSLGASKARLIPPGSVLVTCIGYLGRTSLIAEPSTTNQQINAVIPRPDIDSRYLMYAFGSPSFHAQLGRAATSTTVSLVNKRKFSGLLLPVPPLDEQKRIVEAIEEQFSRLDAAQASIRKAQRRLAPWLRATRRTGVAGSTLRPLGEVCELYQPKTITMKELVPDGPYVVFGANGVIGRYHSFNHEEAEVLVTCRGATCGTINVSLPKSWITGNAMVARPRDEGSLSKAYLRLALLNVDLGPAIAGSAQPQITRRSLSPILIPVPPPDVQADLVARHERDETSMQALEAAIEGAARRANSLRRSLLQDAFAGRLLPTLSDSRTPELLEEAKV